MSQDLGARLLRAGLVTRGQLGDAVRRSGVETGAALMSALVSNGLPEDALAGFFLSVGFGPLVERHELDAADAELLQKVSRDIAEDCLALPLHSLPDGIATAMGDPTNSENVERLSTLLSRRVLPRVARVRELQEAIAARASAYEARTVVRDMSAELALMNDSPVPDEATAVELVRRRPISFSSNDDNETTAVGKHPALVQMEEAEASAVPLVRQKPISTPAQAVSGPPSEAPWSDSPTVANDSWADGLTTKGKLPVPPHALPTVVPKGTISPRDPLDTEPGGTTPGDITRFLTELSVAGDRDLAVRIACEASLTVAGSSVFFSVKKDVIQGRDGDGNGVSKDVVRSLSIPLTGSSNLRKAAVDGVPYYGALGKSAAEALFAAVIGARGNHILFQPIHVSGKAAGLLCLDGVQFEEAGRAQVQMIADALAAAFSRIIKSGKK